MDPILDENVGNNWSPSCEYESWVFQDLGRLTDQWNAPSNSLLLHGYCPFFFCALRVCHCVLLKLPSLKSIRCYRKTIFFTSSPDRILNKVVHCGTPVFSSKKSSVLACQRKKSFLNSSGDFDLRASAGVWRKCSHICYLIYKRVVPNDKQAKAIKILSHSLLFISFPLSLSLSLSVTRTL